jgi:hypothetical protein
MRSFVIMLLLSMGAGLSYSQEIDPSRYLQIYKDYSLAPQDLRTMNHTFISEQLKNISGQNRSIRLQTIGISAEQRDLFLVSFGKGKIKLLLWSQMHGDECTATAALLAIFNYFAHNDRDPVVQNISRNLSINVIPMLNPDGAEINQRWNAQDIDINRDARGQMTPEGRILKQMQEQIKPDYGFNLHDMMGREMAGESKKALYLALMAPPYNKEDEDSASRIRAKKLAVYLNQILEPLVGGHIARYKADYMPRAFGDAMQNWGVSTILIESGLNDTPDPHYLVKLNFVALLSAFDAIAAGKVEQSDAALYNQIPLEGESLFDILIRDVLICNGTTLPPFRADIGINIDSKLEMGREIRTSVISEIGDLSLTTGLQVIEGANLTAMPGRIVRVEGDTDSIMLVKCGITTALTDSSITKMDPSGSLYPVQKDSTNRGVVLPDLEAISINTIPSYTSVPAAELDLKELGLIKRNKRADLLIFRGMRDNQLYLTDLIYVIKNGAVIKVLP